LGVNGKRVQGLLDGVLDQVCLGAIAEADQDGESGRAGMSGKETVKAVLTDVQFWVPALVLLGGIVLLVVLH